MSDTIICTAIRHAAAFSTQNHGFSIAVSLNFDCRAPEADPRARFEAFLKALPDASFRVFRLEAIPLPVPPNPLPYPTWPLQPTQWRVTAETASKATPVSGVMSWLDRRKSIGEMPPTSSFWLTDQRESATSLQWTELRATHLLGSALVWPAPLPQDAGLVRLVALASDVGPLPEDLLIVVPFLSGDPDAFSPTDIALEDGLLRFTYDAGTSFTKAIAEIRVLDDAVSSVSNSLIDASNGFLLAPLDTEVADVERVVLRLQRIQHRAASAFWAFPPLQSIEWEKPDDEVGRLVWRAMNGLATLLDPILLALTMPQPSSNTFGQQGPFLASLAACVPGNFKTAGIATFFREKLGELFLLGDESNASKREGLVALLADVLQITIDGSIKDPIVEKTVESAEGILPVLLRAYAREAPDKLSSDWLVWAKARFGELKLELALGNELNGVAQALQTEDRIEQVVVQLFEKTGLFDSSGVTGGALAHSPCTEPGIGDDAARTVIASFKRFLAESLNGLDAIRHAQGRLFELHLVAAASARAPGRRWSADDLGEAMKEGIWFARRIDRSIPSTFHSLDKDLPLYATAALSADNRKWLLGVPGTSKGLLAANYEEICEELLQPADARRFLPDHAPSKLQLQIAVDNDADDFEHFAQAYRGLCVLLRRAGEDWAHCNLAELNFYDRYDKGDVYKPVGDPGHPERAQITLLPLQPILVDGQCQLFLEFDGQPFSSRAFVNTTANETSPNTAPPSSYLFDDPSNDSLAKASFDAVPALAYGTEYKVAAFLIGKGGAVPVAAGVRAGFPWLPSNRPSVPATTPQNAYTRSYFYQRSTAIGRTGLEERVPSGTFKRIGVGIDNVQPLFRDFPRIGMSTAEGGSVVLDVLRNADGTGAAALPKPGETVSITLENVWWWGAQGQGSGSLRLSFFSNFGPRPEGAPDHRPTDDPLVPPFTVAFPSATTNTDVQIEVKGEADPDPEKVTLTFDVRVKGKSLGPQRVTVKGIGSFWTRLTIIAADSTKPVSLSLSDPSVSVGASRATTGLSTDSLLLLAPSVGDTREWRAPYTSSVSADVTLPRMGFTDLDRWLSNNGLFADSATLDRTKVPSEDDKKHLRTLVSALMTAYIVRNADKDLGALLERLPDLAVDQLLFELTPLDALYDEPTAATSYVAPGKFGTLSKVVPLRTLGKRISDLGSDINDLELIKQNLLKLSDACSIGLECSSRDGDFLSIATDPPDARGQDARVKITVPRGMVARLTVRPMVRASYLDGARSVFKPEMATLSSERRGDYYLFEGVSLAIESMLGALASSTPTAWQDTVANGRCRNWEELVARAVAVRPAGISRSYDLVANPISISGLPHAWRWRQLANIDIETQRWRFTGKPIYSWLDPTAGQPDNGGVPRVVIEQRWTDSYRRADVTAFETECFFDRDAGDVDTRTMLLHPSGDTVLQAFPWEQPSATYFRHRLWIRSRYEGALQTGQIARQRGWGDDAELSQKPSPTARSWIRVALLADRTRLQLTRPQLRALIPLTRAPTTGTTTVATTPPVMAVLDERPFAHGGLADRIVPEIRTGLGYVLPKTESLQIEDARKEFGPDPRLTYTPTSSDDASSMTLLCEGPVGLTFDSDAVRNPAFPNTALVLHPLRMTKDGAHASELEEHFLSVGLRRFLDPAWLADSSTTTHAIADSLWIGPVSDGTFTLGAAGHVPVVSLLREDEYWVVRFNPAQLDSDPSLSEKKARVPSKKENVVPDKELCRVHRDAASRFFFLHSPLEKGRAALSVLAVPASIAGNAALLAGLGNQPVAMASIEWQVPEKASELAIAAGVPVRLTSASPTTLMNWTRTGRNFDAWHASDGSAYSPHHFSAITVRRGATACTFETSANGVTRLLHFVPERSRYPNPLHVHRHLSGVATKNASGLGRPLEVFDSAFSIVGSTLPPLNGATFVRLVEFETPARPLLFVGDVQNFNKAHFDLFSILGQGPEFPAGFSLFMRLLGGRALNTNLKGIAFDLEFLMKDGAPKLKWRVTTTNKNPGRVWHALSLAIPTAPQLSMTGKAVYEDGSTDDLVVTWVPDPANHNTAAPLKDVLAVQIIPGAVNTATQGVTEFWTDVSILTLPPSGDFTFDWFFTGADPSSPAQAVAPAGLQEMVEAQGRIIAVSPPIPVID